MLVALLFLRLPADDAVALLSQSVEAYRRLASYADEGTREVGLAGDKKVSRFHTWYRRDTGMRSEWRGPLKTEVTWTKEGDRFDFVTTDEPALPRRMAQLMRRRPWEIGELPNPVESFGRWVPELLVGNERRYNFAQEYFPGQKWIRQPDSTADGVRCDVVGMDQSGTTFTFWLDHETHLVRQIEQRWRISNGKTSSMRTIYHPRPNAVVRVSELAFRPPLAKPLLPLPLPPIGKSPNSYEPPTLRPETANGAIETVRRAFSRATTLSDEMERLGEYGSSPSSLALRDDGAFQFVSRDKDGDVLSAVWSNGTRARTWQVTLEYQKITVLESDADPKQVVRFDDRFFPSLNSLSYRPGPPFGGSPWPSSDEFNRVEQAFSAVDTTLDGVPAWQVDQRITSGFGNHIGPRTTLVSVWLDRKTGLPMRETHSRRQNGSHEQTLEVRHHYRVNPSLRPGDFAFRPPSVDLWETLMERRDR